MLRQYRHAPCKGQAVIVRLLEFESDLVFVNGGYALYLVVIGPLTRCGNSRIHDEVEREDDILCGHVGSVRELNTLA